MWYDIDKTLSHNCLFNFVVGPRGVGKTYSFKNRVIKNFLKKGEQWVYLRRYDTELKSGQMEKFFDDIMSAYPEYEFKVENGKFYIDGHVAGFYMPLSQAAKYKSVPYPNVSMIGFDEFIIDRGMIRYLPNEVVTFNEMYSTIARLRDVRVMFLSNAITFTNPYFVFFDLSLQQGQKITKKGDILLELVDSPEYTQKAAKTRFGRIIANTDYGKYAIENQFLQDKDTFIEKIPGPGIALFVLKVDNQSFCVYDVMGSGKWYVSNHVDPSCKRIISMDVSSHDTESLLSGEKSSLLWIEEMKQRFFRGELRFTTMKAKNLITNYIKKG